MDRQGTITLKRKRISKYKRYRPSKLTRTLGAFPLYIRISYTWAVTGDNNGATYQVLSLSGALQGSNDWSSCKGLYANYNVRKCTCQYLPCSGLQTSALANNPVLGMAYDHSNQTPLTQVNQIGDYENYAFGFPGHLPGMMKTFSFSIRPLEQGPWNTNDNTNYMGWLKLIKEASTTYQSASLGTIVVQFYCIFGGMQ